MKIKEIYSNADKETQAFWRKQVLANYSLLQAFIWFRLLENPRPKIMTGDEVMDDGKPVENIHFTDILKLHFSLNPNVIMAEITFSEFFDWFIELDEDAFYEETEDECSNWLDYSYMSRAWNYYIKHLPAGGRT